MSYISCAIPTDTALMTGVAKSWLAWMVEPTTSLVQFNIDGKGFCSPIKILGGSFF